VASWVKQNIGTESKTPGLKVTVAELKFEEVSEAKDDSATAHVLRWGSEWIAMILGIVFLAILCTCR